MSTVDYAVVVPTVGRDSLWRLLNSLANARGPHPAEVIVVDDRPDPQPLGPTPIPVRVLTSGGRGPAAARNVGWRATEHEWIAFLDDDVVLSPDWPERLAGDLARLDGKVAASKARITVPLPADRAPTDAELGTAGLAKAEWITADMAYRRSALAALGGFDERFPRAYREDAELAMRVLDHGLELAEGGRRTIHPVREQGFLASVRAQRGNADDALLRRLLGTGWRERIGGRPGRLRLHTLTTAAAMGAAGCVIAGRPRAAILAGLVWAGLTAEFAARRIQPGPRTPAEITRMVVTSAAIPPMACLHRLRGELRHWRVRR
ncbi:glycosyltransferase family 2 protein [Crossiella sp. CA198]|uniref:glycosyltransferase family 2 protein n=1 Tax=Crossiella sp. CA198 TaxID=3455607 RepID=UPI003F8D6AA1